MKAKESRRIGAHLSIAGGLHMAIDRADALGCSALQMFSHNPRGWHVSPITPDDAALFRQKSSELDVTPVFIHTSYLINLASPKDELRQKSLLMLRNELLRAHAIGAEYVVTHTGTAHDEEGIDRAIASIIKALKGIKTDAKLLIENTSGKRGDITSKVRDLAAIKDATGGLVKGVCIDSCHAYAAGYDLSTAHGIEVMAAEVEKYLGADAVRQIHLNDSKGEFDSGTDRHEHLGKGNIGIDGLSGFINHKVFAHCPVILETPKKADDDDEMNLATLSSII